MLIAYKVNDGEFDWYIAAETADGARSIFDVDVVVNQHGFSGLEQFLASCGGTEEDIVVTELVDEDCDEIPMTDEDGGSTTLRVFLHRAREQNLPALMAVPADFL